jgi:hypothetical protein
VSVVGGITGVVYADEVQLQYGEGAQVTVAISGALEVTAVVTVTYSTPSLNGGVPCFFIGTFGPPGPLVAPNLPAPPTAGWVNVQPTTTGTVSVAGYVAPPVLLTKSLAAGPAEGTWGGLVIIPVAGQSITVYGLDLTIVPFSITVGQFSALLTGSSSSKPVANPGFSQFTGVGCLGATVCRDIPAGLELVVGEGLFLTLSSPSGGYLQSFGTVQYTQQ